MTYLICNEGCHDTTYTEMSLNTNQLAFMLKFARENNKTGGGCQPVIQIYRKYKKSGEYYHYNYDDDLVKEEDVDVTTCE